MSRLIDISQTLSPAIAVWPGDTEFRPFWVMQKSGDTPVNVGSVTMSLHTGTHADAPKHFRNDGESPDAAELSAYVGRALVIDLSDSDTLQGILPEHLAAYDAERPERVLFRTNTAEAGVFPKSCAHFTEAAAQVLVGWEVRLVGIDTPSVDQLDSKSLPAHHVFDSAGIAILENLVLGDVKAGWYELIALPLKFADMDASPVRAVLRTLD